MKAIYLHMPDGTATKWSMCSECKTVAAPGNYDVSEKCCTCYDCGKPLAKDEKIPYADGKGNRTLYHRACEQIRRTEREAARLEKAELIPDYDGPVYFDGLRGSYGDGYFADVDELAETLDDEDDQSSRPAFAHCCESSGIVLDADSILETATQEMYEDFEYEDMNGVDDLREAIAVFNRVNEDVKFWSPDYKRKVAVPAAQGKAGK